MAVQMSAFISTRSGGLRGPDDAGLEGPKH